MPTGMLNSVPQAILSHNVTRLVSDSAMTTATNLLPLADQSTTSMSANAIGHTHIFLAACFGFVLLILATVLGNTLVLLALYLDKRLHSPSFYLIANMAIADLLLGLFVLPFSSVLELLNDRWVFGQGLCSAWLALDVLCCTASIVALMAVSIDRYIGVTRPLNYGSVMTTRRTIYLIIVVWAVSILTSVVPLFGLTDREKKPNDAGLDSRRFETCKVNKNTFYTIFSSLMSFYIPAIILLILYSRVYQEAKKQGKKLENEKRRLYEIDYQIASEHLRRRQTLSNGDALRGVTSERFSPVPPARSQRSYSDLPADHKTEITSVLLKTAHVPNEDATHPVTSDEPVPLKTNYSNLKKSHSNGATPRSESARTVQPLRAHRSLGQRLSSTLKRNSQTHTPHLPSLNNQGRPINANDELIIIKRKLHNLKREKKAFRTLGLILSALLICWLPFFVILPVVSIRKHYNMINYEHAENMWFKIAFWLGYCNSALNPFVYAFSNRAIQRAFRQVIFRRFCCCDLQCWLCRHVCPEKSNRYQDHQPHQYQRARSNSFATQTSQVAPKRTSSYSPESSRTLPKTGNGCSPPLITPMPSSADQDPIVCFAEFLEGLAVESVSGNDDKEGNSTSTTPPPTMKLPPQAN